MRLLVFTFLIGGNEQEKKHEQNYTKDVTTQLKIVNYSAITFLALYSHQFSAVVLRHIGNIFGAILAL